MIHPRGISPINAPEGWQLPTTLEAIGADNLRSLVMPGPLQLRRLMILAGGNGIGKSTFARLFPLLRQSIGTRTREPILWWDRDGVDFGTFADAVRRGEDEIRLRLRFDVQSGSTSSTPFDVVVVLTGDASRCTVQLREVSTPSYTLTLSSEQERDGKRSTIERPNASLRALTDDEYAPLKTDPSALLRLDFNPQQALVDRLTDDLFLGNASPEQRVLAMTSIPLNDSAAMVAHLSAQPLGARYKACVSKLAESKGGVERLFSALQVRSGVIFLSLAEAILIEMAQDTAYLGPFRAVPERLYRAQSLAVETLDNRGLNLPMFLLALTEAELADLNGFLNEHLSFAVRVEPDGTQHRVDIQLKSSWYNIVDVGFGYSQLLPVAVQIWAAGKVLTFQRRKKPLQFVVIEQPELHLHPHHQALLGRALVASAAAETGPIQVIETHSSALIEEVGLLVARGKVAADRVGIYCFEPRSEGGSTVREAHFDEEGVLHDWPAGFLSP